MSKSLYCISYTVYRNVRINFREAKACSSPPAEPQLDDPSILNMGDPSILNMGAITPQCSSITPKSVPPVVKSVIDPSVANQIASLSMGTSNNSNANGKNKEMDRYTWQQTQGILNGHPNGNRRWRSQHSNSPRVSRQYLMYLFVIIFYISNSEK